MALGASLEGTVLTEGAFSSAKIAQCIKEATKAMRDTVGVVLDFMYLVLGHPVMRPDTGFVKFVCFSFFCPSPLVNP
jgi:predicted TIM-barrel enzyme